jgi:cyanophycinase
MKSIFALSTWVCGKRGSAQHGLFLLLFLGLVLCIGSLLVPRVHAQRENGSRAINPPGIDGALLLCGEGKVSDAVIDEFVKLAGGPTSRIVVFLSPMESKDQAAVVKRREEWKARKPQSLLVWPGWPGNSGDVAEILGFLRNATGIWIGGEGMHAKDSLETSLQGHLHGLLQRQGVLAATSRAAALVGQGRIIAEGASSNMVKGWDLLPGASLDLSPHKSDQERHFKTVLTSSLGLFGVGIEEGNSLLVRGREMRAIGAGHVSIYLAETPERPARTIDLHADGVADFTALRRAAIARSEAPFPAKELAVPEVAKGTLVIVGGGAIPPRIVREFIESAGGADAPTVVLPTSNPDPLPPNLGEWLKRAGAKNVHVLTARVLADVEAAENLEVLKQAKGVWFDGGRQWRFVDAYAGTKAEALLHDVLRRGGVIGGSSAGATIQGEYLCRGNPLGPKDIMSEGYERGLSFLPGVAIDQHFTQRRRQPDMTLLMKTYPQLLGIGLDEGTALVVQGSVAKVMGRGRAHFYDRRKPVMEGKPDYEALSDGGLYDLNKREALPGQ